MLDTLKHCLHSQSTKHDERYFSLQDTNHKFDQKNINNSDISINSHKEVLLVDKETISGNHEKSNTERSNQKSTKEEITTDVINKISSQAIKIRHLPVNIISRNQDIIINQLQGRMIRKIKKQLIKHFLIIIMGQSQLRKRCLYWGIT